MIVSLLKKNKIISLQLPQKISGQYWIEDSDEKGNSYRVVGIEAINNEWYIKSNRFTKVVTEGDKFVNQLKLENLKFYKLKSVRDYTSEFIYTEPDTNDRQIFTKYVLNSKTDLTIGRDAKNKICYKNNCVSSRHAVLSYDGIDTWTITDENSTNGTFVNSKKVNGKLDLQSGDIVYILGLKIIIGGQFFAINNPDSNVIISSSNLVSMPEQKIQKDELTINDENEEKNYYRSPKFKRSIETFKLKVDAPPTKEKTDDMPLAFVVGPSMTMGIASLFTAMSSIVTYIGQDPFERNFLTILPTIAMAIGMLAGTVLWPILTKKVEKKNKLAREKERKIKYVEYLNECREVIQKASENQKQILIENNPSIEAISSSNEFWEHDLWSRLYGQHDFLSVRIGKGDTDFDCDIKFPEKTFSLENDDLIDEVNKMSSSDYSLKNVPIVHSFFNTKITGVASSNREKTLSFINNIILQTTMLQSYDEVKIVLIANQKEIENFQYLKWIPHFWNNEKTLRYFASSIDEVKDLSNYIDKQIEKRLDKENEDNNKLIPHYLVIATDKELTLKTEFISRLINCEENVGFSLLFAYGEMKDLPKECSTVIEIRNESSLIYDKNDISDTEQKFVLETISGDTSLQIAKEISNVSLDLSTSSYVLPSMLSFLEMFGVGKIEHLNALSRWKQNNPVQSLQTPVGVDTNGEPFMLDLHEKFHGPHGLVAGMTGSGKSEFIITFILSLAVNYHPDEVSFILIDYKGGGLTGAFENGEIVLPHLAGTITNLDGSAIKRSLLSIESELRRRQTIFNEARRISNEGTMDIYKYQKLYRNGVVSEPVPHLFIISDEFAELKDQQPEFMDQLISTARIGRSLGVHLILATQKPNGVVNDQIWSNSRFRVCLKVQDKSDSMDMIKRADAAEISQTGRFYLQVGFNELFELGQSAWSGAPYIEQDTVIEKANKKQVCLLDNLGRESNSIVANSDETIQRDVDLKQIVEINKYIYNLAKEEDAFAKPLWLPPIPEKILVDDLKIKYDCHDNSVANMFAIIGEYDDPTNQKQNVLKLSFEEDGNVLVYGSMGSGKEQFLTSIIYSLASDYDARALNTYILDFGSETLKTFERAPQVADVVLSSESEKIKNLFKLLQTNLISRKKLFSNYGGSIGAYISRTNENIPRILVLVNNYASFIETYEEYEDSFVQLLREGYKYGIHFVVTATNYSDLRFRVSQNFNKLFVLQMNDSAEYSMLLGNTNGLYPSKFKGRGLVEIDDAIYEFQTATAFDNDDMLQGINDFVEGLLEHSSVYAEKIPVLPEKVNQEFLSSVDKTYESFVLGVDYNSLSLATYDFTRNTTLLVSSEAKDEMIDFCFSFVENCKNYNELELKVFDAVKYLPTSQIDNVITGNIENELEHIYQTVLERHNKIKTNNWEVPDGLDMHHVFCVIFGMSDLIHSLSPKMLEKLDLMLEKNKAEFNVSFIIFDNSVSVSDYFSSDWFKEQVNNSGLWIGEGIVDQYVFSISKRTRDMSKEINNEYAFLINRGKPRFVKLIDESEE